MIALLRWLGVFLRILWACRVSLINVLFGLAFFGFVIQAQNLMADLSSAGSLATEIVFWAGVFAFTFLLWAFPVHYGARLTLDRPDWMGSRRPQDDSPTHAYARAKVQHAWLITWLPRVLGLMPFVALALGIAGARSAVAHARSLPDANATLTQGLWLYGADAVTALAFVIFVILRRRLMPDLLFRHADLLQIAYLVVTAAMFFVAYAWPIWLSVHLPRALLVPPLFGSLVLLCSWLARLGHRTGFPCLLALGLLLGVATGFNVEFNQLRTLPGRTGEGRLTVHDAVANWRKANCTDAGCPHPIVIAIDGGASRAAFTAATFVGELLDRMPKPTGTEAVSPGRRIFAISGVSGGSYGAAVIQSALADAQTGKAQTPATPPCLSAQTTWFGYQDWLKGDRRFTWRQCLQALTSGDYLSSTIIGLAFRDFLAPPWQYLGLPAMSDRAALLEKTWERQYAATLEPGQHFFEQGDSCVDVEADGLCRRMAHPATFFKAKSSKPLWMPMLLLNGTSVATGRRIVAADLASAKVGEGDEPPGGALYSQGFDLREAMSLQCPDKPPPTPVKPGAGLEAIIDASQDGRTERTLNEGTCAAHKEIDGLDVRLSTAALTSARFPLISPAGIFAMDATLYGDQVVDGGYFENSGLTTALDIVAALEAEKLEPSLVSISNNPAYDAPTEAQLTKCKATFKARNGAVEPFSPAVCTGLPRRPAPTPLVPPSDNTFLGRFVGVLWRPFQTLVATGDGHGDEALARAETLPLAGRFYHLKAEVTPDFTPDRQAAETDPSCVAMAGRSLTMANVSMSWWLAAATQADLDIQRCSSYNRRSLQRLDDMLLERVPTP